jgi:hypothetical protein
MDDFIAEFKSLAEERIGEKDVPFVNDIDLD